MSGLDAHFMELRVRSEIALHPQWYDKQDADFCAPFRGTLISILSRSQMSVDVQCLFCTR